MSQLLPVTHDLLRNPACHETMSHQSATFRICFASMGKFTGNCTAQCNVYHYAYPKCPETRPKSMEMRLKCPKLRQNLHYIRILDSHGFQRIYTANEAIYAYIRRYAYTEYRTRSAYITALAVNT